MGLVFQDVTLRRNIYEKLFMLNWPMYEKMTEKVVSVNATPSAVNQGGRDS